MTSIEQYKNSAKIKSFVSKLFEVRQTAHNAHLSTKSYSEHKALGSFYEEILGLSDAFIETFQGQYGIISGYENINVSKEQNVISYIENAVEEFKETRKDLEKDTHLQNIIDEMISLSYSTLYKLKFLK